MAEKAKKALSGKKTYIVAALMFIIGGAHAIKALVPVLKDTPDEVFKQIMTFVQALLTNEFTLGGLLAASMRAAIGKAEK